MKEYRIEPNKKFHLKDLGTQDDAIFKGDKKEGREEVLKLNARLEVLQELLFAEHKHRLLVILQGMDTSGKDGVIRSVFEGVNPQGVRVASFKVPTAVELDHDYLWRIHQQTPGRGEIVIFNRSHYEDVLVVRVHSLVPRKVWERRFEHMNKFEKTLADEGTTILKFFLHISPEEQRDRLLARLDEPAKRWKFNPGDLDERKYWDDYTRAYEEVLSRTSTPWAPWYVVPADRKWYRDLVIATVMVDTLEKLDMKFPEGMKEGEVEKYRRVLLPPVT